MAFGIPEQIQVKYENEAVQSMLSLLRASPFPEKSPIDPSAPWKLGMDVEYLKKLKHMFLTEWSWSSLEKKIAQYDNFVVHYEHGGDVLDLHFVHAKSPRSDAIPLILLHGWPGTFFDFHKVIESLTDPKDPETPAFHVVVPSLPGYILSTLPRRETWNLADTARVFNELMTSVLGYEKYMAQGGDWGSLILRIMASTYPESVSLAHFNLFISPIPLDVDKSAFSEFEKRMLKREEDVRATGFGYFMLQSTKPFTIGYAVASSPLAVLAYIGEKIYTWSDPHLVNPQDILDTVALYYLSGSFPTSVMMYYMVRRSIAYVSPGMYIDGILFVNQSTKEFAVLELPVSEGKFLLKNKFGFSAFPYENTCSPKAILATYGPLAYHKEHSSGGHFPALDCPNDYISDLREFVSVNKDSLDGADETPKY
ncbi:hypothetical protein ACEPAG_8937 [Sanghuangporus baumii]